MLFGIGIDVVRVDRIERIWKRSGELLAQTILLANEYEELAKQAEPVEFLAQHFAAKEAVVKAMGTGFGGGIWVNDVGATTDQHGQAQISFSKRGQTKCDELGISGGYLSISQASGLVCAVAVLTRTADPAGLQGPLAPATED